MGKNFKAGHLMGITPRAKGVLEPPYLSPPREVFLFILYSELLVTKEEVFVFCTSSQKLFSGVKCRMYSRYAVA